MQRRTARPQHHGSQEVRLSAGSTAVVRVSDSLSVTASAGPQLEYLGNPAVQVQTSAGSTVRRAGS